MSVNYIPANFDCPPGLEYLPPISEWKRNSHGLKYTDSFDVTFRIASLDDAYEWSWADAVGNSRSQGGYASEAAALAGLRAWHDHELGHQQSFRRQALAMRRFD